MNYFVNVWEISDGSAGEYRTYRLYSGESPDEIKFRIVNDLKDTWVDVSDDIDDLENPTDMDLGEIGDFFSSTIEDSDGYITDCHIEISNPYTDVMEAVRFYRNYEDDVEEFDDAEVGFYAYGDYAVRIAKFFPYISSLCSDYGISINNDLMDKLIGKILI
jgi:hypothetical protein